MPIQALTVRELLYDAAGQRRFRETRPPKPRFQFRRPRRRPPPARQPELQPGQKREETEGVFVIRDGKATFVPVKLGIAGERYLEVLSGLKEGDHVITGPFESVRGLFEGDIGATPASRPARSRQSLRIRRPGPCRSSSSRSGSRWRRSGRTSSDRC